ncbi:hypothetical protein BDQ17DRAFT_1361202 [Cyathus striatus]|nr:hypothetical protein BDQ17DRAFT_1361202 [Cyathus striatus]
MMSAGGLRICCLLGSLVVKDAKSPLRAQAPESPNVNVNMPRRWMGQFTPVSSPLFAAGRVGDETRTRTPWMKKVSPEDPSTSVSSPLFARGREVEEMQTQTPWMKVSPRVPSTPGRGAERLRFGASESEKGSKMSLRSPVAVGNPKIPLRSPVVAGKSPKKRNVRMFPLCEVDTPPGRVPPQGKRRTELGELSLVRERKRVMTLGEISPVRDGDRTRDKKITTPLGEAPSAMKDRHRIQDMKFTTPLGEVPSIPQGKGERRIPDKRVSNSAQGIRNESTGPGLSLASPICLLSSSPTEEMGLFSRNGTPLKGGSTKKTGKERVGVLSAHPHPLSRTRLRARDVDGVYNGLPRPSRQGVSADHGQLLKRNCGHQELQNFDTQRPVKRARVGLEVGTSNGAVSMPMKRAGIDSAIGISDNTAKIDLDVATSDNAPQTSTTSKKQARVPTLYTTVSAESVTCTASASPAELCLQRIQVGERLAKALQGRVAPAYPARREKLEGTEGGPGDSQVSFCTIDDDDHAGRIAETVRHDLENGRPPTFPSLVCLESQSQSQSQSQSETLDSEC